MIYPPPLAGESREGADLNRSAAGPETPGSRVSCATGSIELHPGGLGNLRPFLDLGADEGAKFRSRHRQRHDALLCPRLLDLDRVEDFPDFGIEAFDDRLW